MMTTPLTTTLVTVSSLVIYLPVSICQLSQWLFYQIGMSETRVFNEMHPDAMNRWHMTMNLEEICRDCSDRNVRLPRQVCSTAA